MLTFVGLLDWPECVNVRDVGGLPAGDSRTRTGALVRADNLLRLTDEGIAAVRAYGVSRVIDLRASWETSAGEHPFATDPLYRLLPFIDEIRDQERDPDSEHSYADLYRGSFSRNGRTIAAAVAAIADAPDGAVVVHCVAGADRTGMLIALVLDAVGVTREAIAADYARTAECLAHTGTSGGSGLPEPGPETILEALEFVDREFGGAREYLLRNGMSAGQLDQLRARLID